MLYECEDFNIENYADDITPYARAADNTVISELQTTASKLFIWLGDNHMKANPEKGHLLLSSKTPKKAYFGEALGESISTEKLLWIQIDSDLILEKHIFSISNKEAKKINVLSCLVNYMSHDQCRIVMKAFIDSKFN